MSLNVVFNYKTGKLIRIVDCEPIMVTMSGEWSTDYTFAPWDKFYKAYMEKVKEIQVQDFSYLSHGNGD